MMINTTFTKEHLSKYLEENNLDRNTLTEFTIPNGVTGIGPVTFRNCTALTAITLPDSLTIIYTAAFHSCTSLTAITLPDNLTAIGNAAFEGCTALTAITLPDNLTEIGALAFEGCSSLTAIELPDSLTEIGALAFRNCTALTAITLPDNLAVIGWHAFGDPNSLQYIFTNLSLDWTQIGIDTSRTERLTYRLYLEQKHASLLEETGMHNLQPHEAYLIYKMINDQDYLPTWNTLKDTFPNRSTTQFRDLLMSLGKNIEAINDVIPSINITINDTSLYQSIFTYMSIKDCESIFDGNQQFNLFLQTKIKKTQDDSSKIENQQSSIEHDNSTAKIPDNRNSYN